MTRTNDWYTVRREVMLLKIPELETMRDRFPRVFEDCLMFIRTGLIRVLFKKRYLLTLCSAVNTKTKSSNNAHYFLYGGRVH